MPYIQIQASTPLSAENEEHLRRHFGKMISIFPGKTERWLMLHFEGNAHMAFSGDEESPCAMVTVSLFGRSTENAFDRFTSQVCTMLEDELGIPGNRVYVQYEEKAHWGFNGSNF